MRERIKCVDPLDFFKSHRELKKEIEYLNRLLTDQSQQIQNLKKQRKELTKKIPKKDQK